MSAGLFYLIAVTFFMPLKRPPTPVEVFREAEIPLFRVDEMVAQRAWWLYYRANRDLGPFMHPLGVAWSLFVLIGFAYLGFLVDYPTVGFFVGDAIFIPYHTLCYLRRKKAAARHRDYMNWVHMTLRESWESPFDIDPPDAPDNIDPY